MWPGRDRFRVLLLQQYLQDQSANLRRVDAAPCRHGEQRALAAWNKPDRRAQSAARGRATRDCGGSRLAVADHLARHRRADLFLDTLPYNAHTTASDPLWAGLPLVTCQGDTFAGRVAASLLNAVGLPELISASLEEYEALALRLARDTARFACHIKSAYETMWQAHQDVRAPAAFAVASVTE